ncbi:hypothetical protein BCR33DRAFT_711928 [Rhizoclosmatium globosum]|uniref:G-patch domain-containing protein n=1 Tax=Rhizoclosmatium globosum TaxID=329046 RepID=A0A1Y2D074_9FUNG|nr:hypothetical protein BCR33DRAFT_711928 [Rhizoclosmatium globosum]|eukprot:ORY52681.1 hypothetical protein BCR33DRAFT_711928 [Rhizoclosmatium globosum]
MSTVTLDELSQQQLELEALEADLRMLKELELEINQVARSAAEADIDGDIEPLERLQRLPQSDSADSASDSETLEFTAYSFSASSIRYDPKDWQSFSNGIAAAYMKRMGHRSGTGLGVRGDGIVDPIEAIVGTVGKGLGWEADKSRIKKRKRTTTSDAESNHKDKQLNASEMGMFAFLNTKLNVNASGIGLEDPNPSSSLSPNKSRRKQDTTESQDRASLIQLHKRTTALESEITKIQRSMSLAAKSQERIIAMRVDREKGQSKMGIF